MTTNYADAGETAALPALTPEVAGRARLPAYPDEEPQHAVLDADDEAPHDE